MASSFPPHPSATITATAATPASDTARRVVTVLIARRVAPASVAAFEAAMQGMLAAAESFPGHLGGQVRLGPGLHGRGVGFTLRWPVAG